MSRSRSRDRSRERSPVQERERSREQDRRRNDSPPRGRRSDIPAPEELHTVMVAGYHYDTTKEELQDFFHKFGDIAEINMPLDYHTRKPRGMAFVQES